MLTSDPVQQCDRTQPVGGPTDVQQLVNVGFQEVAFTKLSGLSPTIDKGIVSRFPSQTVIMATVIDQDPVESNSLLYSSPCLFFYPLTQPSPTSWPHHISQREDELPKQGDGDGKAECHDGSCYCI